MLYEIANAVNKFMEERKDQIAQDSADASILKYGAETLRYYGSLIGLFDKPQETKLKDQLTADLMTLLIDVRAEARKQKQFALSDLIRDRLANLKIQLKDSKDGTTWEKLP